MNIIHGFVSFSLHNKHIIERPFYLDLFRKFGTMPVLQQDHNKCLAEENFTISFGDFLIHYFHRHD